MTRLTDTQTFYRPVFQPQGPDDRCVINGHPLGWSSCTSYAFAMATDAYSQGTKRPSGCAIRRATHDTIGGTTLRENADAVADLYGISVSTYTGANVLSPARVAALVRAGHRVVIQGDAEAMIGTPHQSTAGAVAHAIALNEVRGGTVANPKEVLVYDSAADGRKRGYHVDQGPSWWPWSLALKFAAMLRPNGPGSARLGPGKVYAAVWSDSEPHVRLVTGGKKSHPFPDRARADEASVHVHSKRSNSESTHLYTVTNGRLLVLYQYAYGDEQEGTKLWGGNDDGTEWVHLANVRLEGGNT